MHHSFNNGLSSSKKSKKASQKTGMHFYITHFHPFCEDNLGLSSIFLHAIWSLKIHDVLGDIAKHLNLTPELNTGSLGFLISFIWVDMHQYGQ